MVRQPAAICVASLVLLLVGVVAPGPAAAAEPEVSAAGAVLWDPVDQRILWGREAEVPRRMASTTKVMTVLLALEAGTVDDEVEVSARAAATGREPGAASLGLDGGDRIPMRSLLAGLVLRSGNDAAVAVAEHLAGDEATFTAQMNARAVALGLTATAFVNATGLTDDAAHHASPRDLAVLGAAAMANPDFAAWAGAQTLDIPGLGSLVSRNELLGTYPGATGVKTGFTNLAGLCLVASATRDGRPLFAVVLGSEDSFRDAAAVLDHGFADFRRTVPVTTATPATVYRWAGAEVGLVGAAELGRTVAVGEAATWRADLDADVDLPVAGGAAVGLAELLVDGQVVGSTPLRTAAAVPAPPAGPPAAVVGAAVQDVARSFLRLASPERAA